MSSAVQQQFDRLQASADEHGDQQTVTIGVEELGELMHAVNQTTEQLQATHVALHEQVQRLQGELAEANAQLRRSQSLAALGEMATGIAHEIRNPLASIHLYAQTLNEELAEQPQQAALCTKINRAVNMLDGIVRDVLLFAREVQISPTRAAAHDLFERALTACESLIVNDEINVHQPGDSSDALTIEVDTGLMTQALSNVVRNAVEAMSESDASTRELRLDTSRQWVRCPDGPRRQRIVLTIADTGPGIPDEVIERMFNPFFTTRKTGTGLGLAIVNRIVEAHGGHVHVNNHDEGGAEVAICLPPKQNTQEDEVQS